MRKAFDDMDTAGAGALSFEDLRSYMCDHLGFGQSEALRFFEQQGDVDTGITFAQFQSAYALLNPYMLSQRTEEVIMRKPGSIRGEGITLEKLEDCEVYICDRTAQVFVDFCKRSLILLGPCESSVFVRDCEDCTFWVAAQQLRTNNCRRCGFYLYARTEPIIETSEELSFAPWAARYPSCTSQFGQAGFDLKKNLWNGIFDFSGKADRSHWRIIPLAEIQELTVDLDEPPSEVALADNPAPAVTHEILCAAPIASGQSSGESIANIPQTRPPLPKQPVASVTVWKFSACDAEPYSVCGAKRLPPMARPLDSALAGQDKAGYEPAAGQHLEAKAKDVVQPTAPPPLRPVGEATASPPPPLCPVGALTGSSPPPLCPAGTSTSSSQPPRGPVEEPRLPRRQRVTGHSLVAKASKYSKEADVRKAFDDMNDSSGEVLTLARLRSYLCDHLGFGQAEATSFFDRRTSAERGGIPFESFREGYATLNPYMIAGREKEVIVRKPGSLRGEGITLDRLEECEVYICDKTAQVFLDFCKRSLVLVGPCESSIFVRDCEDCTFWLACQQLRTNNCKRCTFHLHAKTEPIIETSEDLAFAPWAARYPGCSSHFQQAGFDPQKNMWNAIFDFSGVKSHSHWRILPVNEVSALSLELDEPPSESAVADNPVPPVTHEMLCAAPLPSGMNCGDGLNIPQTRPPLPARPGPTASQAPVSLLVRDAEQGELCGAERLDGKAGSPPNKAPAVPSPSLDSSSSSTSRGVNSPSKAPPLAPAQSASPQAASPLDKAPAVAPVQSNPPPLPPPAHEPPTEVSPPLPPPAHEPPSVDKWDDFDDDGMEIIEV